MALHHYVSQVHLKRFYSPTLNELMYAVRKSDLKRFTPTSKAVCRLDEGNTNEYLTEPRAIEEFLKTVEGKYNAGVAALESGQPDQETIYVVAGFASYVMACSPAAMRINSAPLQGALEVTARLAEKSGLIPAPPANLGGKDLAELLDSGKVKIAIDPKYPQAIGIANVLQQVALFGNFRWDILINEHGDCPFFTSDFPVGIEPTPDPRVLNRIVPLAPTVAVRFQPDIRTPTHLANFEFRGFSFQRRKVTRHEAVEINRVLVRSAEDTVFFRDDSPWVAAFVEKNRHFRIETENIQFPQPEGTLLWSRQAIVPFRRE